MPAGYGTHDTQREYRNTCCGPEIVTTPECSRLGQGEDVCFTSPTSPPTLGDDLPTRLTKALFSFCFSETHQNRSMNIKALQDSHRALQALYAIEVHRDNTLVVVDVPHLADPGGRAAAQMVRGCVTRITDCYLFHSVRLGGQRVAANAQAAMFLFADVAAAVQWCVAVQVDCCQMTWPKEVHKMQTLPHRSGTHWNGPSIRMGIHTAADTLSLCHDATTGRPIPTGLLVKIASLAHHKAHPGEILCSVDVAERIDVPGVSVQPFGTMQLDVGERRRSAAPSSPRAGMELRRVTPDALASRVSVFARELHDTDVVPAPRLETNSQPTCVAVRIANHRSLMRQGNSTAAFAYVRALLERSANELDGFPAQRTVDVATCGANDGISLWMFSTPVLAMQWALQLQVECMWSTDDVSKAEGHETVTDESGKVFSGVRLSVGIYATPDVEVRRDHSPFTAGVLCVSNALHIAAMMCGEAKGGEILAPDKLLRSLPKGVCEYVFAQVTDLDYGGGIFEDVYQVLPKQLVGRAWVLKSTPQDGEVRWPVRHAELCKVRERAVRQTTEAYDRHALRVVSRADVPQKERVDSICRQYAELAEDCHTEAASVRRKQVKLERYERTAMHLEDHSMHALAVGTQAPLNDNARDALLCLNGVFDIEPEPTFLTEPPPESPRNIRIREMQAELDTTRSAVKELQTAHESLCAFVGVCITMTEPFVQEAPAATDDELLSKWLKEPRKGARSKKAWKDELNEVMRYTLPADSRVSCKRLGKSMTAHCGALYQHLRTVVNTLKRQSRRSSSIARVQLDDHFADQSEPASTRRQSQSLGRLPSLKSFKSFK